MTNIKTADKIIAACGNDCVACPRYTAHPYEKTDEELHHTAELWMRIGYRDHVVTNEEIACYGCKPENWCRYRVIKCCEDHGIKTCGECSEYPCDNIRECFAVTKSFEPMCRQVCTDDEYKRMEKAFFEKEKNLSYKKVKLDPVQKEDIETLWRMQVEAFKDLLDKYQDFDLSPAAESIDKVIARFEQPWTKYYFIIAGRIKVGAIRVVDKQDGSRKRISPIWIMPEYRNKGYAQQAILAAEKIYGSDHWCLDTILQEEGNLHLYEKLGYHQTGRVDRINDRMDIVFYEKDENRQMDYSIKTVTIDDYDAIYDLWNSTEQSRRALNPVDDSREGIARYLKRNPDTCFAAVKDGKIIGVILTGHDGRRAIVHHLCVHPDYRRMGIAGHLVSQAEEALQKEGIQKVFGLVFKDNESANAFWEQQGYSIRTNLNYRNKSLNDQIPAGE